MSSEENYIFNMPELPEVQTVVSQLGKKIVGKTVIRFWSDWRKRVLPSYSVFSRKAVGAQIQAVRRIGKHIVIDLDNGHSIVIHLKMTGHLLVKHTQNKDDAAFSDPINGYIHHIFTFSDKATLEFSDMRKFGWLRMVKTSDVEKVPSVALLGIDALSSLLNAVSFETLLSKRGQQLIATVLLEQNRIAGIGNIYRNEALFLAHILPERKIETLSKEESKKLLMAIKKVLRQAVKLRGTTDGDFRDTDGLEGNFKRALYVYGRTGKPCKKCDTMILRKKIGQRSVFYCPDCQK